MRTPLAALEDPGGDVVYAVAFIANGTLATGGFNGSVYLWDVADARLTKEIPGTNSQAIYGLAYSAPGNVLAASIMAVPGLDNGDVVLWNTSTGSRIATLTDPQTRGVGAPVSFSADGATLAVPDGNGKIYLWNTATHSIAKVFDSQTEPVYDVAFDPVGDLLAAADGNDTAQLWNVLTSQVGPPLSGLSNPGVHAVAFSPDGKTLATASETSAEVDLWVVATGRSAAQLEAGSDGIVSSIAYSPSGRVVVAVIGTDPSGVVDVWNTDGKLLATLHDPDSAGPTELAFSPDGRMLAVGDGSGHTYVWDMSSFGS